MYIQGTRIITDPAGQPKIKEVYKRFTYQCRMENGRPVRRPRGKRQHPTTEAARRYNAVLQQRKIIRKINANFQKGDLYLTLTYPAGSRPGAKQARADLTKFIENLRRRFKKENQTLKWISRTEIGAQGAVHHHIIIPRFDTQAVENLWNSIGSGHVNIQHLYGHDFSLLATYFVKPEPEDQEQLTLLPEEEKVNLTYRCSRNLFEPPEHTKKVKANSWRQTPHVPAGWMLDKQSHVEGINPFTGYGYQYYRLVRLEADDIRGSEQPHPSPPSGGDTFPRGEGLQ